MKALSEREKYLVKLSHKKLRLIKKFYNDRIKRRPKGFCSEEHAIMKIANMNLKIGDVIGTCMCINETVSAIHKELYRGFTFGYTIKTKEHIACGGGQDGLCYEACVGAKKSFDEVLSEIHNYANDAVFPERLREAVKNKLLLTDEGTIREEYVEEMRIFCNRVGEAL